MKLDEDKAQRAEKALDHFYFEKNLNQYEIILKTTKELGFRVFRNSVGKHKVIIKEGVNHETL